MGRVIPGFSILFKFNLLLAKIYIIGIENGKLESLGGKEVEKSGII